MCSYRFKCASFQGNLFLHLPHLFKLILSLLVPSYISLISRFDLPAGTFGCQALLGLVLALLLLKSSSTVIRWLVFFLKVDSA
jgi:hypothetical protein